MKECSKCKETKELSEFYQNKKLKSGYVAHCKQHQAKRIKELREADLKKFRKRYTTYALANKENLSKSNNLSIRITNANTETFNSASS